jgi:hypothetical protein
MKGKHIRKSCKSKLQLPVVEEHFVCLLTQQVLNGQIGSPKSFEFQELFSQGKQRLFERSFFFKMFPYVPNFNPQKQKPAISVCGPRQLIVNSRRSSQNMRNGWCRFLTIQRK